MQSAPLDAPPRGSSHPDAQPTDGRRQTLSCVEVELFRGGGVLAASTQWSVCEGRVMSRTIVW